eukprot:1143110-Lingulodinium_polyedra.AAC.1
METGERMRRTHLIQIWGRRKCALPQKGATRRSDVRRRKTRIKAIGSNPRSLSLSRVRSSRANP